MSDLRFFFLYRLKLIQQSSLFTEREDDEDAQKIDIFLENTRLFKIYYGVVYIICQTGFNVMNN